MRGRHRDTAAYELGVLDDAEEFETHLDGCPRCRELLAGFHPVSAALAEAARLGYLPGGGPPVSGDPAADGSPATGDPAPAESVPRADAGYPPPSRRRTPDVFTGRRGPVTGALLLLALGVAVTVVCATRPTSARTWFASAASIVSPAQVVAGTGHDLRDLPWSAGFQ
ncbi:zf-HC2 domain-containing protein [Amycolatopsis sp. NPDC051371]|uniref:zf-HC2 domain-containing protein n=1 Tax=Amycolatopsis sp. NPDC051371 TaxID=3155800 RepID=UPI003433E0C1